MRRADRLFQIIQLLRRRRITTAAWLAEKLEVSERTIYRDIQDLIRSGVPIEGEAGVGYVLLKSFDLPPLMFTEEEIEALVLGARIVKSWADPALAQAAEEVLAKVETVLPARLKNRINDSVLFSPNWSASEEMGRDLGELRVAIRDGQKVRFTYTRADDRLSTRTVRPLCLAFFAPTWLLTAWCELRQAFRNFRVDRIVRLTVLDETFESEPGQTLEDFMRRFTSGP